MVNKESSPNHDFASTILGSATAALIGRIMFHPIDTAKSRLQSPSFVDQKGTFKMIVSTFRAEGFRGLYGGFNAVLVGGVPATCIYLSVYEKSKKYLSEETSMSPFLSYVTSGMLAEICCCFIYVPVDIIKERLQVQSSHIPNNTNQGPIPIYNGAFDAARKILHTDGFRGIYKGYFATLLSYGPFSALYFLFYEKSKQYVAEYSHAKLGRSNDLNTGNMEFYELLACSAVAGSAASFLTSPLDLVRLRLQLHRGAGAGSSLKPVSGAKAKTNAITALGLLSNIYEVDGIRGLFRGVGARVLYFAPNMAVTMATFDYCRHFWADLLH